MFQGWDASTRKDGSGGSEGMIKSYSIDRRDRDSNRKQPTQKELH
jgi:hypothetical protein